MTQDTTYDMKKDMILHKIGQLIVPLKRTMSPFEADSHSALGELRTILLLLLLMMTVGVGQVWGQEPITITTDVNGNGTIQDNEKILYLIQSFSNEAFYIRNDTKNGTKLNTSNIVTTNSEFYFLNADIIDDTQYYYIVHNGTGKYVYVASAASGQALIYGNAPAADATDTAKDLYRFKITKNDSRDAYNIIAKGSNLSLFKKNGNSDGAVIELNSADDDKSCWNFIAKTNYSKPAVPFSLSSLNGAKHKYYIQNNKYTTYYLISGTPYVTTNTQTDENKTDMKWYFVKAPASETDPYMNYYYIIHAQTGKYLRYTKANNTENSDQAVELSDYNSSEDDRFLYIIVRGSISGEASTTYCIAPYLPRVQRVENTISLCRRLKGDGGNETFTYAGVFKERGNNNFTHWNFISATLGCEAPEVEYANDGKIQVTCETNNVTIWYTTDNSDPTDESNGSRQQYNETNKIEVTETMTVVKAYAVDPNGILVSSDVTTFILTVDDPVITYDVATNKAMISCTTPGATILYTTSDGDPTNPYPTGGIPLAIGDETIKAIAKKGGVSTTTPVTITVPFQTTVGENKRPYIIQSKQCQFYNLIPNVTIDENTKYVSTLNVPCTTMAWHFKYAEEGYYYIVDANGWYMYYTTTDNSSKYIYLKSTLSNDNLDNFKFQITAHASGGFNIIPKGQSTPVNKADYGNSDAGLKPAKLGGSIGDNTSRWDIIQYSLTNLPQWVDAPFDNVSDDNHTYYYKIISVSQSTKPIILNSSDLIRSETPTEGIDEKTMWVIKKVGAADDDNDLLDFYTFQNVFNGELLYYNGKGRNYNGSVLQLGMPTTEGAIEAWSHFVIVQTATGYNIIPRSIIDETKAINRTSDNEGFNCLNRRGGGDAIGTWYDDGDGSRWTFSQVDFCLPPFFEESNGNITISCDTKGAEIHYLTNGNDPTGGSTLYDNDHWSSSDQVRIKAIAVVKEDETVTASSAVVTLLNKPDITLEAGPYEYKGTAWEPSLTVSIGESGSETTAPTSPATYTATYSSNVNVGTAAITLTDADPTDSWYIWNGSTTFTITQKAITITAASDTKGYDGTPLTNGGYTCSPELATGDSFVSVTVTGSQTDVGSSSNVPSAAVINNESDEDMTTNYAITYTNGTLTVTVRSIGNGSLASGFTVIFGEGGTIILKDGEETLTKDTDYSIGSETTSESGKYSQRTVSGIGNYEGYFSIRSTNVNFQNDGSEGTEYSATFVAENAAGSASNNSANGHALPEGITAYIITSIIGNNAYAEALEYIPEGIPVLLLSNAASGGFLVQDASGHTGITSTQISNNMLEEVTAETPGYDSNSESANYQKAHFDTRTIYLLYKNEFVYNMDGYLAKGKVYLNPNPSSGGGNSRLLIIWNTETGINNSQLSPLTSHFSGTWYTLDGRRLNCKPTQKGLYLCNGQKTVVR